MKNKIAITLILVLIMSLALGGCSKRSKQTSSDGGDIVYAVETGSAGEAVAKEKGYQYNSVASQADALMEVASGTSDAAIIDLLMAGAMIGEGTSYPDMIHTDELTTEEYGVQESLVEQKVAEYIEAEDSDVSYIQGKGTLIVGITDFKPMDYKDGSDEWIGFDADMARIVVEKLGVEVFNWRQV